MAKVTEIAVTIGKQTKWISGLTETTTCNDIVTGVLISTQQKDCPREQVHLHYALVEVWRGVSKVLSPSSSILAIWSAWAEEQPDVSFIVKRIRHPKLAEDKNQTLGPKILPKDPELANKTHVQANKTHLPPSSNPVLPNKSPILTRLDDSSIPVPSSKTRLEEMRQSVREVDVAQARKRVARRASSLARRQRGPDTLHPRMADRSKEELRAGIQARMRMMMAQKETIERELLKLQRMEVETAEEAPPPPLPRKEAADTSQDSGVDSGAVTDDGDARKPEAIDGTAKKHSQEGSHYSYIDGGLELRPPPDNLDLVILTMERVEGMNKVLGETEEEIVALGFELSMLADSGSRVASPLDCFTTEVTRFREINAKLLQEITVNRGRIEETGARHEKATKMVKRVEFDINLVERESKRLEDGLQQLRELDRLPQLRELEKLPQLRELEKLPQIKEQEKSHLKDVTNSEEVIADEKVAEGEEIEIDFDCLDDEEIKLTDFGLSDPDSFIEPPKLPPNFAPTLAPNIDTSYAQNFVQNLSPKLTPNLAPSTLV